MDYEFKTAPSLGFRLSAFCAQFTDLCSEFGTYIAPTYRHDRCEGSVQMRLYALSKRQFVLVFVAFFCSFFVTVFIGLAGPPIVSTVVMNAGANDNLQVHPSNASGHPYILPLPGMSTLHQQLWLIAQIELVKSDPDTTIQKTIEVGVQIRGKKDQNKSDLLLQNGVHNRTRQLRCKGQICADLILLHLGYIDYSNYIITVYFYNQQDLNPTFTFKSFNPAFTQLEIWFRFIFLVLTFLATCLFAHSLRRFSMRDWSIEQKWMSILLPLLLLYNDPIFPLTFLVDSWVPGMFDAIFQALFLCALLLFWLCLYHGVRQNERHFVTFYIPKLLVVGLIWITAVTLASWQAYNEMQDPTYNYRLDTGNFTGFKIFFFIIGGVYLLYLIYLLIRAYAELRSMPYFDLRLKFMTSLMLIVLAITVTITVLRFGASVLQDNFVAEITTRYQNSAEFVAFYGLLNFYLYTMAYVYSPSKNALFESHFKDNPTVSMLNDSDEDQIYGSDYEETSLTTALPAVRRSTRYDSEDDFR